MEKKNGEANFAEQRTFDLLSQRKWSVVNFHPMESCRAPKGLKALLQWMHQWVFMSIFLVILTHKFLFKSLNHIWFWLGSYEVWETALCNWACGWLSFNSIPRLFWGFGIFMKKVKILKSPHTVGILSQPAYCFPFVPRPTVYPFLLAFHLLALKFSLHKTVPGY